MEEALKELREITHLKSSIDALRSEVEIVKQNPNIEKALILLEQNHENLNKNMIYLKDQFEQCVLKSTFEELESTFYSIHSEHKILQKKLQTIEEMFVNNRNDFFNQIAEMEKFFISKNENIKQAICHICRSCKVVNPLI